jgi:hypothetical protein
MGSTLKMVSLSHVDNIVEVIISKRRMWRQYYLGTTEEEEEDK